MRVVLCMLMVLGLTGLAWGRPWREAKNFAYQLQDVNLDSLADADFDLVVIDYSLHGDHPTRLTPEQVKKIQKKPKGGGKRLVLAYLSIGEAEDYRYYWRPDFRPGQPKWLMDMNPAWPGNYPVRFWDPAWQTIVFDYLDHIARAGFDGVYLDCVDVYERFPDHRQDMVDFVLEIARRGRRLGGPDFGIFPQNAEELVGDDRYLEAITGLGKEETYYGLDGISQASPKDFTQAVEPWLRRVHQAGKLVLNIDYTTRPEQAGDAHRRAAEEGFLEYVSAKDLSHMEVALNSAAMIPEGPTPGLVAGIATPSEVSPSPAMSPSPTRIAKSPKGSGLPRSALLWFFAGVVLSLAGLVGLGRRLRRGKP